MRRNEYVAQPTAAAIDTAMARALSLESEHGGEPTQPQSIRDKVSGVLGQSESFERGFVQAAGLIVAGLQLGRVVTGKTALLGANVTQAMLTSIVTYKVIRGITPARQWLSSKSRQIALGIACGPVLTWFTRGSFDRSERATVWTAWSAALVGVLALFVA